jgi:hypothetical protein
MAWTVEYVEGKRLALVIATGAVGDEDARTEVAETLHLLKEHEATLVLVDCTEAVTEASLAGIYHLPDYATQLGAPWQLRVALVIPKSRFRIETYQFFALVFRNAGYDVRLFEARDAAEEWLLKPRAVRSGEIHFASV